VTGGATRVPPGLLATVVVLGALLAAYVAAGVFAHPIADDFDSASSARQSGFATAWRQQYLTWNGRYSLNALALAVPLGTPSLTAYRAALALMAVAFVAALYAFLAALAGGTFGRVETLAATLTLSVLFLSQMPALGQAFYWYTGAVTYQAPLVLALLHLACVIRYCRTGSGWTLAAACALLVAAIGFNEVTMLMLGVLYAVLLAWSLSARLEHRASFGLLLAVSIVAGAIVVLSPGNAARAAMYPARHQLVRSLGMTLLQTLRFVGDWVSNGPLLLASAAFLPMAGAFARVIDPRRARACVWLSIAGLALVVPIAVFPPYWAQGILGQHRTVNVAWCAFVLLWFLALGFWAAFRPPLQAVARSLRAPLLALLLVSLACTRNSYGLGLDIIGGRFAAYDREMQQREAALRACHDARAPVCALPPIHTRPASFFVLDISADPRDWVNLAYANYFGVGEVRLAPAGSP